MCCGSRRSAWRNATTAPSARSTAPSARGTGDPPVLPARAAPRDLARGTIAGVMLRYLETDPIRAWGPVTGRPYDFSSAIPVIEVDPRDAAVLARSGLFRRA
jgi:hypothetical protein